jgi:hypothetical protein
MQEGPVSRLVRVDGPRILAAWQKPDADIAASDLFARYSQGFVRFRRISWPKDRGLPRDLARFPFVAPFVMDRGDREEIVVAESDHMSSCP